MLHCILALALLTPPPRVAETRHRWVRTNTPTWFALRCDGKDIGLYSVGAGEYFSFKQGRVVRPPIDPPKYRRP